MKKRNFFIITVMVLCICITILFTACWWGGDSSNKNNNDSIDITVYVDDNPKEFSVTDGTQAEITSFTKSGHYLTGIYDQEEGGTKYFDSNGRSLGIWQKDNPTTFYAQWEIFSAVSKIFDARYPNDPYSYSTGVNIIWPMKDELLNAVNGNLDKDLYITLTFKIKEYSTGIFNTDGNKTRITLKDTSKSGAETFGTREVAAYVANYESHSLSWTAPARCGRTGSIVIEFNRGNNVHNAYVRDLVLTVSFA